MCSDTRVGVAELGSSGHKLEIIRSDLFAMVAGNISRASELVLRYRQLLSDKPLCPLNVFDELRYPPQRQKALLVDEYFRLRWSVTRQEYLEGILKYLPESEQARIAQDVERITLGAQLILGTFIEGKAVLFTVLDSGEIQREMAFGVIGSGYAIAYSALCQRQYSEYFTQPMAEYAAYEAKRLSEVEPTVGPDTTMLILENQQEGVSIPRFKSREELSDLERCFRRLGPRPIPRNLTFPRSSEQSD